MYNRFQTPYNEAAIQNIRLMIENAKYTGIPVHFEFKVDGLTLIPYTNNLMAFDSHVNYLHEGVQRVEFKLYHSTEGEGENAQQKISTFSYVLPDKKQEQSLQGIELEEKFNNRFEKLQLETRIRELEKQVAEYETEIQSQDEWIEILTRKGESLKEQLEQEKNSLKGLIKEVIPYAPGLIKALPGLADTAPATATDTPAKMSFSLQGDPSQNGRESSAHILHNLTEEEQKAMRYYVGMGKKLEEELSQEELELFIRIAEVLYQHPDKIKTLAQLLDIDPAQDEDHL